MVALPTRVRLATIVMSTSAPAVRTEDAVEGIDYLCPACECTLLENVEIGTIRLAVKCFGCKKVWMPPV
jgi:hypothetical protein